MHPEHAEHHRAEPPMGNDIRIVRLEPRQMAQITIVVRCGGVRRFRLRLAMWLMRVAGRIGGFKGVKMVRKAPRADTTDRT